MSKNKDNFTQSNNYNDSQYNKDYYTQGGQYNQNSGRNYQQSDYVPQSYGASNRYDDLYDYEESGGGSSFLVGILVGGIVGAAAALFLAPKSGKEFQADLKNQATTLKEKAAQQSDSNDDSAGFAQQLKEQSTKVVDKVKNMKGGTSPMDDGTASSEGEESINIHSTVQNSASQSADKKGSDAFTSTANALKEAVEEVKEEKKSGSSSSSIAGNTGSSTNSNTANSSAGPNTTSSNNNSNKSSNTSNTNKSTNSNSNNNSNNSNNKSSNNSSSNNYNKKN